MIVSNGKKIKKIDVIVKKMDGVKVGAELRAKKSAAESGIMASIHETVADLHRAGVVKVETMREFDEMCLAPVEELSPAQIVSIRKKSRVSQPVLATYLNVSKSSVSQWERGDKKPDGAAMKLLNLVKRKGLEVLA
ncbi:MULTISPECIES: helix-turn-helix domain-containing protein [Xanthomonas]|nr:MULTISPECIES: DNA-binding transcriptional regulator [Xanthomonas]MCP3043085.1 DNA-binding transcriptional regulator [Xanthomonas euvesicatoria pv. allii]MDO6986707.1 DNA-binding transcriptional regulator [Xanthomonas vasicola]